MESKGEQKKLQLSSRIPWRGEGWQGRRSLSHTRRVDKAETGKTAQRPFSAEVQRRETGRDSRNPTGG